MTRGRQIVSRLLDAAKVGQFTVPDEITAAVATIDRIEAAWNNLPETPPVDVAELTLQDEIYEAAWAGRQLPNIPKRWAALKLDAEVTRVASQALRAVLELSDERLLSVFHAQVDAILMDRLKAALREIVTEGEGHLQGLQGARTERDAFAEGPEVGGVWREMQGLAVRYSGVRDAYGILWRSVLGAKTADTAGVFAEFSNAREIYPQSNITRTVAPWPSELAARFVWIIAGDAKPWLSTPEEQDQALEAERERNAELMARPTMKVSLP